MVKFLSFHCRFSLSSLFDYKDSSPYSKLLYFIKYSFNPATFLQLKKEVISFIL